MLYGTVRYVLKAEPGREVEVPWAGRVVFEDDDDKLRMRFYQVYLVGFFSGLGVRFAGMGMDGADADLVFRIRLRSRGRNEITSECRLCSGGGLAYYVTAEDGRESNIISRY